MIIRRALLLLATVATLTAALPMVHADAHAFLTDSNPADGAVVASAPTVLRLGFSESVVISAVRIEIVGADQVTHAVRDIRLAQAARGASTESPVQVLATMPNLPPSAYRVSWQTLSSDDLHRASGVLVFGVGRPVTAAGVTETPPRSDEASLRWLLFVSLSVSLGGLLAARLARRSGGQAAVIRRCARLSATAALAGAISALALLTDLYARSGTSLATLLRGSYGERWALRELGFALLFAAAIATCRGSIPRLARSAAIAAGAAGACAGTALLGHSASGNGLQVTRVVADAAHVAAAATWAGTLLVFLMLRLSPVGRGTVPTPVARGFLRSFGRPAAACVGVMVVTGIYLASGVVGSVDAALLTTYGRILLAKLTLVGLIGALALINHRRVRASGRGVGRTVALESILAIVVLGLTALLTSGQPALESQFVSASRPATVPVLDSSVGDLQEALAIRPNQPGRNVAIVDIFDTRRPAPAPVRRVLVTFTGLDGSPLGPVSADRLSDGRWSVATNLAAPGSTSVEVTVQRAGLTDATHVYRWTVGGGLSTTHRATVSTRPIGPALRTIALWLMAILVLSLFVIFGAKRFRSRPSPATVATHESIAAVEEDDYEPVPA